MSKSALIVVDIQNDYFPGGKWPLVGADAAADNAAKIIQATRDSNGSRPEAACKRGGSAMIQSLTHRTCRPPGPGTSGIHRKTSSPRPNPHGRHASFSPDEPGTDQRNLISRLASVRLSYVVR